jgi:hypothetical protein
MCDQKRRESPTLEFRGELDLSTSGLKNEVERDIQGLANSGGGRYYIRRNLHVREMSEAGFSEHDSLSVKRGQAGGRETRVVCFISALATSRR